MARGVIPKEGVAGLFGPFTDASQLRAFLSSVDPQSVTGTVLGPGDSWFHIPAPGSAERPYGLGFVRYEDLYKGALAGQTLSETLANLGAGSPNALPDGSAYITFPEGQFISRDMKAAGSTTYSIYIPKNCKGLRCSGRGTVGGTTGTEFMIAPNSWTAPFAPLQSTGQGNPFQVMYRGTGTVINSTPIIFDNFRVAGTNQGDVDGRTFQNFTVKNPEGPVTFQNILTYGWYGTSGAPPGETFGLGISGSNGPHRFINCEADGRRVLGGPAYGAVGFTVEDTYGATFTDCFSHHGKASSLVFYQAFASETFNFIHGPQDYSQFVGANQGINHERTSGTIHHNLTMYRSTTNKLVNMTHSNDTYTTTIDGHACSTVNGGLTVINPTFEALYSDGKFYIQSWTPYSNGDTMQDTNPPLVTLADGVTHLPYKWVHGASMNIN